MHARDITMILLQSVQCMKCSKGRIMKIVTEEVATQVYAISFQKRRDEDLKMVSLEKKGSITKGSCSPCNPHL